MSCYTGFFNVRRGWQSLNTGPRFYLRLIRRTGWFNGCELIYSAQPTDAPSSRRSSRSHFYTLGLTPFRGLVPLGRRNLVPILPRHTLWEGGRRCRHFHFYNENNAIFAQFLLSFTNYRIEHNFFSHVQENTYSIVHHGILHQNV